MGEFDKYLERRSASGTLLDTTMKADAAEIVRHGISSMLAEGQDRHMVHLKAIPIFGEDFLVESGVVELLIQREETK
jgi:hypothetical protein